MPAAFAKINTMAEGLPAIGQLIAQLKFAPDADIDFLTQLETAVLSYSKQSSQGPAGGQQAMAQPGMEGMAAGPAAPLPAQGGVPGLMQAPQLPPADELRRVVAGKQ